MSTTSNKKPKIKTMEALSSTIGVSRPTLSKYFQDPESVRATSRARIEQALDTVDYTPNFFATKMNRKSTGLIGVIVPHLNDLFFTSLIQKLESRALRADYMGIVQNAHGDPCCKQPDIHECGWRNRGPHWAYQHIGIYSAP